MNRGSQFIDIDININLDNKFYIILTNYIQQNYPIKYQNTQTIQQIYNKNTQTQNTTINIMYKYFTNIPQDDDSKIVDENLLTLKQQIFSFNIKSPPHLNTHTAMNGINGDGNINNSSSISYYNKMRNRNINGTMSGHRYQRIKDHHLQKYQEFERHNQIQIQKDQRDNDAREEEINTDAQQENIKNSKDSQVIKKYGKKYKQNKYNYQDQERQQEQENKYKNDYDQFQDEYIWRPKLPHKRIFDDPKFLLSMERKKLRVINGLKNSQLAISQIQKIQPKNHKLKSKKQITLRPRILSQPKKISQNYTHTSLNLCGAQIHRKTKTPYVNFNLHHLIKQRKKMNSEYQHQLNLQQQNNSTKKGSNLPYYISFKSERFGDNQKSTYDPKQEKQYTSRNKQTRTAKTSSQYRNNFNKSTAHEKRSFNQSINF